MPVTLRQLARTFLALLLCVPMVCLPSSELRLSLCACNGILVEGCCPCEDVDAAPDGCADTCGDGSGCGHTAGCEEGADDGCGDDSGHPTESCCSYLDVHQPYLPADDRAASETDDTVPDPRDADHVRVTDATPTRATPARATGPPFGHRLRRALVEHSSVVLLI